MRRLGLALLVLAALPSSADAHSLVRIGGTTVNYLSADATSLNTLTVRMSGSRIEFDDRTVDGGIDPGTCDPGAPVNSTEIADLNRDINNNRSRFIEVRFAPASRKCP